MRNGPMKPAVLAYLGLLFFALSLINSPRFCTAAESSKPEDTPQFKIARDVGESAKKGAEKVRKDLEQRDHFSPFQNTPAHKAYHRREQGAGAGGVHADPAFCHRRPLQFAGAEPNHKMG